MQHRFTALAVLVAASMAAIAGGIWFTARAAEPPSVPEVPVPAAVVEFEPSTADLGDLVPGVAKSMVVRLRNVSAKPITVTAAIPSCPCTTATWPVEPIAPGAAAEAEITVKTPDSPNESLMKTVTFMVDGIGPATITVRGMIGARPASVPPAASPAATAAPNAPAPQAVPAPAVPTPAAPTRPVPAFVRVDPPIQPGARVAFPDIATFVRGTARSAYEPGKVYVIEFFNTTCSHCRQYAPQVTRLARQFGAKGFEFISLTDEPADKVQAWLDQPDQRRDVSWSVATDPDRSVLTSFQGGTFRTFNPRFFVIRDGVMLWFGHPKEAEAPLAAIAAGTWDPATARAAAVTDSQVSRARNYLNALIREAQVDGDWSRVMAGFDQVRAAIPERAAHYDSQRFLIMIGLAGMVDDGYALCRRIAEEHATECETIRALARGILDSPYARHRDVDLGMQLAIRAEALCGTSDAVAESVVGLAWWSKGDRAKAIEYGKRAVALEKDVRVRYNYENDVKRYEAETPGPRPSRPPPKVNDRQSPPGGSIPDLGSPE